MKTFSIEKWIVDTNNESKKKQSNSKIQKYFRKFL